jgi:hypothetical protein
MKPVPCSSNTRFQARFQAISHVFIYHCIMETTRRRPQQQHPIVKNITRSRLQSRRHTGEGEEGGPGAIPVEERGDDGSSASLMEEIGECSDAAAIALRRQGNMLIR